MPRVNREQGASVAIAPENILTYSLLPFLMMETDLKAAFLRASFRGNRRYSASFHKKRATKSPTHS